MARARAFNLKPNGWLVTLHCHAIRTLTECGDETLNLSVWPDPIDGNDGHSVVLGLPAVSSELSTAVGLALASRVTGTTIQIKSFDN
jgi:hypothetical protein